MEFEWDDAKELANRKKHGVDFLKERQTNTELAQINRELKRLKLQLAALETGVPVAFGVLTVDVKEQARARISKGAEAVRTALEMANAFCLLALLKREGNSQRAIDLDSRRPERVVEMNRGEWNGFDRIVASWIRLRSLFLRSC